MPINFSGSSTFYGPAFAAYGSTPTTFPNGVWTKITFNTPYFNLNNNFSTLSSRFTPTVPGYYQLNSSVQLSISATPSGGSSIFALYRNGSEFQRGSRIPNNTAGIGVTFTSIVSANGTTDYFEMYLIQGSGDTVITESSTANVCPQFSGEYVRSL